MVDLELSKVRERLAEKGLTLVLTDEAKEFLIEKGSNTDYGARPLRRAIENFVEDPLAEELLKGEFARQGHDHDRGQEGRRQEAARLRRPEAAQATPRTRRRRSRSRRRRVNERFV